MKQNEPDENIYLKNLTMRTQLRSWSHCERLIGVVGFFAGDGGVASPRGKWSWHRGHSACAIATATPMALGTAP